MPAVRNRSRKAPPAPTPTVKPKLFDRSGIVGQILKAIAASGHNISRLASLTGISSAQLSRFVRGERSLSLPVAAKLCAKMKLKLTGPLLDGPRK